MSKELRIWKFSVFNTMPTLMQAGAILLDVQLQDGGVVVWAAVDPALPVTARRWFSVVETGDAWPDSEKRVYEYLATLQSPTGLVRHVFDGGEE